jgi:hypothetical protein
MAVVGWRRLPSGLSGAIAEPLTVPEQYEIRVDSPNTSRRAILGAIPVGWNSAHWEFTSLRAVSFDLKPTSDTGMRWSLTVTFTIPPRDKQLDENGIPANYWEATGGTTTQPAFQDKDGQPIVNAAKDPVEGLEREREEMSWTLTRYYTDDSWKADRLNFAGKVNSETWDDGAAKTWKCYFKGATKKEIQDAKLNATASGADTGEAAESVTFTKRTIVETKWEFRYDPTTWKTMPWEVGFQELVGEQRVVILGDDLKPVKQPVALNDDGTRKSPGSTPGIIRAGAGAELYHAAAFGPKFGTPFIVGA